MGEGRMYIETDGQTRVVVVLPKLGIVLKFPRIDIAGARYLLKPRELCMYYRDFGWKGIVKDYLGRNVYQKERILCCLFGGIVMNWYEFWYYITTRHPFCQPTYFSLFGLMNIQRYGKIISSKEEDGFHFGDWYWEHIFPLIQGMPRDSHLWTRHVNYCHANDRLHLVDYGNKATRQILTARRKELAALRFSK